MSDHNDTSFVELFGYVCIIVLVLWIIWKLSELESKNEGSEEKEVVKEPSANVEESTPQTEQKVASEDKLEELEEMDYDEFIQSQGLERSIIDSHKEFTSYPHKRTSPASTDAEITHDSNINNWVGLRRPDYAGTLQPGTYGLGMSSEEANQLNGTTRYTIGG